MFVFNVLHLKNCTKVLYINNKSKAIWEKRLKKWEILYLQYFYNKSYMVDCYELLLLGRKVISVVCSN